LFVDNIPGFLGLMTECGLTDKYNRTHTVTSILGKQLQNNVVAAVAPVANATTGTPAPAVTGTPVANAANATATTAATGTTSHVLYKKSVVMSGTRDKTLTDLLKNAGAILGSSVSKNTFAVVTDDKESTTGKVSTARQLSIPIFTPAEFTAAYF
jgi:NAD-dependent DNA ligase